MNKLSVSGVTMVFEDKKRGDVTVLEELSFDQNGGDCMASKEIRRVYQF